MTVTIHISSMRMKYFISPTLNALDTNSNNSHRYMERVLVQSQECFKYCTQWHIQ